MEGWVVIAGVVIFGIFLAIAGSSLWGVPASTPTPKLPPTTQPTPRPIAPSGQLPIGPPAQASQPAAVVSRPVDFSLITGTQTDCGTTCRETVATLKNTGDRTAHNVCVQLTAHNSDGKLIPLNGGDNIHICIGDLGGGQSSSQNIKIDADCGFLFTDCIGKTLTLDTEATSTEKRVTFPTRTIKA